MLLAFISVAPVMRSKTLPFSKRTVCTGWLKGEFSLRHYRRTGIGLVLLGVLVLDGRLRQALARHQRALKYSRFQPGNKGGKQVARFPERKSKEVA